MEKEHLTELLKKYVDGECTPEEIKLIDQWFLSHEENPDDDRLIDVYERENLESTLFERIKANMQLRPEPQQIERLSSRKMIWYRAAAAVVITMLAGLGLYLFGERNISEEGLSVTKTNISHLTNDTKNITLHMLSDGTVITLQPNGSIEFPDVFPADKREIVLKGEAFFDVTKDKNRPFIINTGDVTVKVLGTSFNVRAYEGAKEITVAVKTGKVSVYAKGGEIDAKKNTNKQEVILTPNQEVVYNIVNENFSRKILLALK